MLNGLPPFYAEDVQEMYDLIAEGELAFPANVFSDDAREFIEKLLVKDPRGRLQDSTEMKKLPWMAPMAFEELLQRKLPPPFVPVAKSPDDTANIDPKFLEEVRVLPP